MSDDSEDPQHPEPETIDHLTVREPNQTVEVQIDDSRVTYTGNGVSSSMSTLSVLEPQGEVNVPSDTLVSALIGKDISAASWIEDTYGEGIVVGSAAVTQGDKTTSIAYGAYCGLINNGFVPPERAAEEAVKIVKDDIALSTLTMMRESLELNPDETANVSVTNHVMSPEKLVETCEKITER